MVNNNRKAIEVEAVEFELAGLTMNGYSAGEVEKDNNGKEKVINYMSGRGLADSLGYNHSTTVPTRMSKELKAFLGKGFTVVQGKYKMASGGSTKVSLWTTDAATGYYTYHAIFNQNPTAIKIVQSLTATALDIIINDAFNREYKQYQAQDWTKARYKGKEARLVLTDAIKWYKENFGFNLSDNEKKFLYVHVSNKINLGLFGHSSQKIKKELNLGKDDLIRDYLDGDKLRACIAAEDLCARLIYQSEVDNGFPKPKELAKETIERLAFKEKLTID